MSREIAFIINKSEITAGTRGASLGPEAIMSAARKSKSELFGIHKVRWIKDENYRLDLPIKYAIRNRAAASGRIAAVRAVHPDLQRHALAPAAAQT